MSDNNDIDELLKAFDEQLTAVQSAEKAWAVLQDFAKNIAGFKLFTVMTVDMTANVARRAYTSHPEEYPVSGIKPIHRDSWFDIVHGEKRSFVANTIGDIAKVFPDHEKIWSMGCGSVINLPVVIDGELAATINMLHEEHFYTPDQVNRIEEQLSEPAQRASTVARRFV